MNKSHPSLEDLGLDAPVDKGPFGKAFDNYDSSAEHHAIQTRVIPAAKPDYSGLILWGCVALCVLFCGLIVIAIVTDGMPVDVASHRSELNPMQVLLDDVDANLGKNIFGKAVMNGRDLVVTVEDDYFDMDEKTKRFALTKVHDLWVRECFGKTSTFKKWDGKVVAEFN